MMGAYKKDHICKDFDKVMRGRGNHISEKMKVLALEIIDSLPDNRGRDFAISNLLYTAEFVKASILEGAAIAAKVGGS